MSCTRTATLALLGMGIAATGCGASASKEPPGSGAQARTQQAGVASQSSPLGQVTASGKPLTRTQLIAKGDTICKRLNARAATVQTTSLQTVGSTAPQLAAYYREAVAQLRKLTPPAGMSHDWSAIVGELQQVPGVVLTMGRFADDNDSASTVRVETNLSHLQLRRVAIAKRDGFTYCAAI